MCNCNQQRAQYSADTTTVKRGMVKVQLVRDEPLSLNGDITGRMYIFRNRDDINWVDKRDAMRMKENNNLVVFL